MTALRRIALKKEKKRFLQLQFCNLFTKSNRTTKKSLKNKKVGCIKLIVKKIF